MSTPISSRFESLCLDLPEILALKPGSTDCRLERISRTGIAFAGCARRDPCRTLRRQPHRGASARPDVVGRGFLPRLAEIVPQSRISTPSPAVPNRRTAPSWSPASPVSSKRGVGGFSGTHRRSAERPGNAGLAGHSPAIDGRGQKSHAQKSSGATDLAADDPAPCCACPGRRAAESGFQRNPHQISNAARIMHVLGRSWSWHVVQIAVQHTA